MIRVFIVAMTAAMRAGLRSLLVDDARLQINGEAASLVGREQSLRDSDVILWWASMLEQDKLAEELDGFEPGEGAGLLVIHDEPGLLEKLSRRVMHGWGLLPQDHTQEELITAVEAVYEGLVVTKPYWLRELPAARNATREAGTDMVEALTGREMEILQLLAVGLTNKQIAVKLGISAHTVKFHLSSIFGKMGTTNRTETVKLGLKEGLISL